MFKTLAIVSTMFASTLLGVSSEAATISFRYDGILGSQGVAVGSFDIDDAELARVNAGSNYASRANWSSISNLTMTVTGASSGNGVFTTADFQGITFYTPKSLDLSKDLVEQKINSDYRFGQPHSAEFAGDLTFDPVRKLTGNPIGSDNAPSAARTFTLLTYGGKDYLQLSSLTVSAVPESSTWALMILGVGVAGASLRRRRVREVLAG